MPCFESIIYLYGFNFEQILNSLCINQPVTNQPQNGVMLFLIQYMTFPHHADVQGHMHFMGGSEAEKKNKTNIVILSIDYCQSAAAD